MGLQSQLNDVASDSIPLLVVALIATCVGHLRSLLTGLCHHVGLSRPSDENIIDDGLLGLGLGSGLASLIVLSEQLNLNEDRSYFYSDDGSAAGDGDRTTTGDDESPAGCVFCLCRLREGDRVRRLTCRHVFHKDCLDGWLDQMKFNCPLCRSPLVDDRRRVDHDDRRRVAFAVR